MKYLVAERIPTVEEYNEVRQAAGLQVKEVRAAERGLANSLFAVCVLFEIP